jgi:hypothetical protein
MATPVHLGARVAGSEPATTLDVTPFVELDDGRRIETEPFAVSVVVNDRETLDEMIRESVLEDDVHAVAASDSALHDWPFELDEIVAELGRRGVRTDAGDLRALPFLLELDPALENRIKG